MTQAVMTRSPFAGFLATLFRPMRAKPAPSRDALAARGCEITEWLSAYLPQAQAAEDQGDADMILGIAGALTKYVEEPLLALHRDAKEAGAADILHAADDALFALAGLWSVGDTISAEEALEDQCASMGIDEAMRDLSRQCGRRPATTEERAELTALGEAIEQMLLTWATRPDAGWLDEARRVAGEPIQRLFARHASVIEQGLIERYQDQVLVPMSRALSGMYQGKVTRTVAEIMLDEVAGALKALGAEQGASQ